MDTNNVKIKNLKVSAPMFLPGVKKIPWILGRHAFLAIIILIALASLFGAFVSYKYIYLVKINQPHIIESPSKFKYDDYQKILESWQLREGKLQRLLNGKAPSSF